MENRLALFALLCFGIAPALGAPNDPVALQDQGRDIRLSNGLVSILVNKGNAHITEMTLRGSANLAGRGAYFAVLDSVGQDGMGDFHNAQFNVVRNTPDLVEISMAAPIGGVHFDQHYILRRGSQGFYVYVRLHREASDPPEKLTQVRWSFYLNPNLFDYHLASDREQGPIPDLTGGVEVQDATVRLPNGQIYTKYNYCTYIEEDDLHGVCGSKPEGVGAFVINPSKEFLQAPTKQDITVHAGPIIHRLLFSGHFEPRELTTPPIPDGYTKLCGPWMVYLNNGRSPKEIWTDAKAQFKKEEAQWPYSWMQRPDYPLERGEVKGVLKLYNGKFPAANALIVLTAPEPNWQLQRLNYVFSARADAEGKFELPHVRPGTYTLFATVPGVTDEFRRDNVTVAAGPALDLGTIDFMPAYYSARLWEIGIADRTTRGFKLADQPRQYGLAQSVPASLSYRIGRSQPARDWYYIQAKPGDWHVEFNTDRTYHGEGVLTIGIAGQTHDPHLLLRMNDRPIGQYTGANSSAEYRSAILGSSYYENQVYRFPATLLRTGLNVLVLRLESGAVMYDTVKLEIDDPAIPKQIPTPTTH